jgi:hypothetical protein
MSEQSSDQGFQLGPDQAEAKARSIIEDLKSELNKVYADFDVSRQKVEYLVQRGRTLADDQDAWSGRSGQREEYVEALEGLNRKINQTLDLKKLKDAGLVRAVKF